MTSTYDEAGNETGFAKTVKQAMDDTKRAQSNLERYVLQASRMTSEEFEQLTGQKKSANVAFA